MYSENSEIVEIPEPLGFEETVFGPLTKPQLLTFLAPTLMSAALVYMLHLPNLWKLIIVGITALVAAVFGLVRVRGKPLSSHVKLRIGYRMRPRDIQGCAQTKSFVPFRELQDNVLRTGVARFAKIIRLEQGVDIHYLSREDRYRAFASYAQFLNSLDTDVQIICRSERLDGSEHLNRCFAARKRYALDSVQAELLDSYIMFFDETARSVLVRQFYVVVSVDLRKEQPELFKKNKVPPEQELWQAARTTLGTKLESVLGALAPLNVSACELEEKELVEFVAKSVGRCS